MKVSSAGKTAQMKKDHEPASDHEKETKNDKIQSPMVNHLKMALDEERTNKCANCGIFQTAVVTHCIMSVCVFLVSSVLPF